MHIKTIVPILFVISLQISLRSGHATTFTPVTGPSFLQLKGQPGDFITGGGHTFIFTSENSTFSVAKEGDGAIGSNPNVIGAITVWVQGVVTPVGEPDVKPRFHQFFLTFRSFPNDRLTPGKYTDTEEWPFEQQRPGFSIGGDGSGCDSSSGSFEVLLSDLLPSGLPTSTHILFDYQCTNQQYPGLTGELALNFAGASIPAISTPGLLVLILSIMIAGFAVLRGPREL